MTGRMVFGIWELPLDPKWREKAAYGVVFKQTLAEAVERLRGLGLPRYAVGDQEHEFPSDYEPGWESAVRLIEIAQAAGDQVRIVFYAQTKGVDARSLWEATTALNEEYRADGPLELLIDRPYSFDFFEQPVRVSTHWPKTSDRARIGQRVRSTTLAAIERRSIEWEEMVEAGKLEPALGEG